MQKKRERRHSIANGDYRYNTNGNYSKICNDYSDLEKENNQSLLASSLSGAGFIEHPISRFDTLAGVAIKYGVEVTISSFYFFNLLFRIPIIFSFCKSRHRVFFPYKWVCWYILGLGKLTNGNIRLNLIIYRSFIVIIIIYGLLRYWQIVVAMGVK